MLSETTEGSSTPEVSEDLPVLPSRPDAGSSLPAEHHTAPTEAKEIVTEGPVSPDLVPHRPKRSQRCP